MNRVEGRDPVERLALRRLVEVARVASDELGVAPPAAEATAWLLRHRWPGNVRELENIVERAATLAPGPLIRLTDLNIEFAAPTSVGSTRPTLAELEAQYIHRVLDETKGDKVAAARILGVSVRTLQRRFG
jgi:DNA-binding NtrC family response regulator